MSEKGLFALFMLALTLMIAGTYIGCRNDMRSGDMRQECISKGGVWFRAEQVCLDIRTIPLKDR